MSEKLDPRGKVGGQTLEVSEKAPVASGVYRHPETGQELITVWDPLFGDPQAEAAKRVGFEYVGPAPEGAIKSIVEVLLENRTEDSSVTGIASRLAKLEGLAEDKQAVEAENVRLKQEIEALRKGGDTSVESPVGSGEGEVVEKPLSTQNKTELLATAEAEGVKDVSEENTNKELVEAITKARAEKESK